MSADPLFSLAGRRAPVTGASRGIGQTLARGPGRYGTKIVLNGHNPERLAAARAGLEQEGQDAVTAHLT
ncbi:hypothetical protein MSKU9_0530 [Komagataeibacter diospyri]|uniref:Uncharacterized protein n=1 Tax=Komagataeibacter diospyri TaxID=1932662 RepID=A0A4P5NLN0_9PROT|nr:hypothetical protein MSKU9_0530 [Komagataeibacter diospyri]